MAVTRRAAAKKPKARKPAAGAARRAYHHGDLRRALIDAALALAAEQGDRFSLREVARACGVDHTAAYRHFADKDALLAAVAEEGWRALCAAGVAQIGAAQKADQRLLAIGRAYSKFAVEHPAQYLIMTGRRVNLDGRFDSLEAAAQAAFDSVKSELVRGIAGGDLREVDPVSHTVSLWAALHGLSHLAIVGRVRVRPEKLGLFTDRVLGPLVRGLATQKPG